MRVADRLGLTSGFLVRRCAVHGTLLSAQVLASCKGSTSHAALEMQRESVRSIGTAPSADPSGLRPDAAGLALAERGDELHDPGRAAADACHAEPAHAARRAVVALAEFRGTTDDHESGYAHAIRWYAFKPLAGWRGVASADEVSAAEFIPNEGDGPGPRRKLPVFRPGERVLVVIDLGGMSGRMQMLSSETRVAAKARELIAGLGPPCWRMPGFEVK